MLFVLFQAGDVTCAVAAAEILQILPCVGLRACPGQPDYVAGMFNLRGQIVPVLDFNRLMGHPACSRRLSTRLILFRRASTDKAGPRLMGLRVESLTETLQVPESEFSQPGLEATSTPFLQHLFCDGTRLIQRVDLQRLVTDALAANLIATVALPD